MSVGENIKKLRELKNYTQSYMASQLEMSVSGYSKIEKGRTDITLSRIQEIAKILETKLATVLDFDSQKIFNQYNTVNSITGMVANQNSENNVSKKLNKMQLEITELQKSINNV